MKQTPIHELLCWAKQKGYLGINEALRDYCQQVGGQMFFEKLPEGKYQLSFNEQTPWDALNRDQATRDAILGIKVKDYDIQHYQGCTIETLEKLIAGGFVNLTETQNDSPSIQEFREFMQRHPAATCHGYVVSKNRSDYRFSIEGLQITKPNITEENRLAFIFLCQRADECQTETDLYSWWD